MGHRNGIQGGKQDGDKNDDEKPHDEILFLRHISLDVQYLDLHPLQIFRVGNTIGFPEGRILEDDKCIHETWRKPTANNGCVIVCTDRIHLLSSYCIFPRRIWRVEGVDFGKFNTISVCTSQTEPE